MFYQGSKSVCPIMPVLRIYGPLEPFIEKTWRPGEIEPVK
jgi:hypothetical protein